MTQENQKIARPPVLKKRLQVFRMGGGKEQKYVISDPVTDTSYEFEPWQFFILEILQGCRDYVQLFSVFEDRFGHKITQQEVEDLFISVSENGLFNFTATEAPLLAVFKLKRKKQRNTPDVFLQDRSKAESPSMKTGGNPDPQQRSSAHTASGNANRKPPETPEASAGNDDTLWNKKGLKLFNPTVLLKWCQPIFGMLKFLIFLLPLVLILAIGILIRHYSLIQEDGSRWFAGRSLVEHAVFSMLTVNFLVTWTIAAVAYAYRATVSRFCIIFVLGILPRFSVRLGHTDQLTRKERVYLHATPLLLRLGLFGTGLLLWFHTRPMDNFLSPFGLAIAGVSIFSFFLTVSPLIKSNGYYLLSAFLNEPHLRGKAFKVLLSKLHGNVYQKMDKNVLMAYALASCVFMIIIGALFLFVLGNFFKVYLGAIGYLAIGLTGMVVVFRMIGKFREIDLKYERSEQFERWRDQNLPTLKDDTEKQEKQSNVMTFVTRSVMVLAIAALFIPYHYEPGGKFIVLPKQKQEIPTEISGIVEEVYFDGGEVLSKGTVIARLSYDEYLAQVKIYQAKMDEQRAVINELKSRPKPEGIFLAERELQTATTKSQFSKTKLERLEKLYAQKAISYEELDEMRREYRLDKDKVEEKRANLALVKAGTTLEQITAEEAKFISYKEEHDYYKGKIDRSVLSMPFHGQLLTLHLKQKKGSYLEKGEVLAIAENTNQVIVQIEVPETDIAYLKETVPMRFRPLAYYHQDVFGKISMIDSQIIEKRLGRFVNVNAIVENADGRLKSGMTGYAKISGVTMPVWEIISLSLARFAKVEVWSWLP